MFRCKLPRPPPLSRCAFTAGQPLQRQFSLYGKLFIAALTRKRGQRKKHFEKFICKRIFSCSLHSSATAAVAVAVCSPQSAVGSRCQIAKAEIPLSRGQAIENFLMAAHFNRCVAQGYAESNSCNHLNLPLPRPRSLIQFIVISKLMQIETLCASLIVSRY